MSSRLKAVAQSVFALGTRPPPVANNDELDANGEALNGAAVGALVREGGKVRLRRHVPANRSAFQRWYADPEIAYLLRHDLQPLTERQSRGYFETIILPLSAQGYCFAIHTVPDDELIGTAAITDIGPGHGGSGLYRIVIGEKEQWERGYGTDATRLVVIEGFDVLGLDEMRLEVFQHNPRAINAYRRVGFSQVGEHTELVPPDQTPLHVAEMSLSKRDFETSNLAQELDPVANQSS